MTVIYGYCGDPDTQVLANIWKNFSKAKVLNTFEASRYEIQKAIAEEKDLLIMCGHGSGEGLFGKYFFAVDSTDVPNIKAQYVIGVWCHAKDFAKKYHVRGFFTSMYISNRSEALFELHGDVTITNEEITESETKFCNVLNNLIANDLRGIRDWPKKILEILPPENEVEEFNHTALEYVA